MTPQRKAVLAVLRESHDHPTAAEVYQRVQERLPGLSCATLYNTLGALAEHGEALELSDGGKASRYDGRNDRHDHAVCLGCNRLIDVESRMPETMVIAAGDQSGFRITGHHTEFYGYCPLCLHS